MKPWQRGFELDRLRGIADIFRAHDRGLILGAFTGVNESRVAAWLDEDRIVEAAPGVAMVCRQSGKPQPVRDFRGEKVATLPPWTLLIERLGYLPDAEHDALMALKDMEASALLLAAWLFAEQPSDRRIAEAMGWRCAASKIRASSELLGLWASPRIQAAPLPPLERIGLARLTLPPLDVGPLSDRLGGSHLDWEPHYSSYSERGTWSALALRGYGGRPEHVEKPAEMSRKWKAEHPDALAWPCTDTPLRALLPEAEPLIAAIPGPKQRIRLMRVEAGGGLSRHADITDKEAGIAEGREARIHIPIVTNPDVWFRSWDVLGGEMTARMSAGDAWYLDTRKPHAAHNGGADARVHLVIDAWVTPGLRSLLPG